MQRNGGFSSDYVLSDYVLDIFYLEGFHDVIQRVNKEHWNFDIRIFLAVLMYASTISLYLQNRQIYSTETVFHEDLLNTPIQTIRVNYI